MGKYMSRFVNVWSSDVSGSRYVCLSEFAEVCVVVQLRARSMMPELMYGAWAFFASSSCTEHHLLKQRSTPIRTSGNLSVLDFDYLKMMFISAVSGHDRLVVSKILEGRVKKQELEADSLVPCSL